MRLGVLLEKPLGLQREGAQETGGQPGQRETGSNPLVLGPNCGVLGGSSDDLQQGVDTGVRLGGARSSCAPILRNN